MTQKYFGILTEIGEIKEANAHILGTSMKITALAVCDGNGGEFLPDRKMTVLPGEKRRAPLNQLSTDKANPNWIIAEQVIPESEGGFWIRGYGLIDSDGDLVAVANCAPTYKPKLSEGSGRTQVVRMVLLVGSVASYELKIDPAVVLATRQYVDAKVQPLDLSGETENKATQDGHSHRLLPATYERAGVVKVATKGEVSSFSPLLKMMTPEVFGAVLGAGLNEGNGFGQFPLNINGKLELITIQWFGASNSNNNGIGWTRNAFPISFPKECFGVWSAPLATAGGGWAAVRISYTDFDRSGFSWIAYNNDGIP